MNLKVRLVGGQLKMLLGGEKMPIFLRNGVYGVIGFGAWHILYAVLFQFFNDVTNLNPFIRNFRFFLKLIILKSFNTML